MERETQITDAPVTPLVGFADPLAVLLPANSVERIKTPRALRKSAPLRTVPLSLREANALVSKWHEHHKPMPAHKFSIGASLENDELVGAAICMRPASRHLDDGKTIEVARLVSDRKTPNVCSLLYSACARTARAMGFRKIQSYILDSESGHSLKAAGWVLEKINCGGTPQGKRTNRPNGHEITPVTFMKKQRWALMLNPTNPTSVPPDTSPKPPKSERVLQDYVKMETFNLDVYIRERVKRTDRLSAALGVQLGELVEALLEMKSRFQNQGARNDLHELKVTGWHDYLESIGVNPSTFRGWKQTCKAYRAYQEAADMNPPKKQREKKRKRRDAERLAETGIDLAKEILRPGPPKVEKQRRLAEQIMDAVMEDDTSNLPVETPERHTITPTLTRREIPTPPVVEQDKHGHAALYHAARVAAVTAANAIEQELVEARFYPVLIFLTDRKIVTFGRFLKTQGIENRGPHGEKWRGRTCFNLPGGEPYRTYEEAWAYVQAFAKALPNFDICYGVEIVSMDDGGDVKDDEGNYAMGMRKRITRITLCNSPEPSHGG